MKVPMAIFIPNPPRPEPVLTVINGVTNVHGDLRLDSKDLYEIPTIYGKVTGHCIVGNNRLTSLKGCPRIVEKGFYCYQNELTSLDGCPEWVGGDFSCGHNKAEF